MAERTLELKNKSLELSEANRALKEMDKLKTEFLANVSHELRTPLNSILGFTLNLLDGVDGAVNDEQRRSLQKVEKASHRLLQLINDVLDLSKLRAGRMEINAERTKLHDVLEEAIQTIEPLARAKEIDLEIKEVEVPPLWLDRDKIIQVLLNLLGNAIKFTDSNGQITVIMDKVSLPEKPGVLKDYVAIRVSDTGIGIKEEDLQNIFKEFVQIDSSATVAMGEPVWGCPSVVIWWRCTVDEFGWKANMAKVRLSLSFYPYLMRPKARPKPRARGDTVRTSGPGTDQTGRSDPCLARDHKFPGILI